MQRRRKTDPLTDDLIININKVFYNIFREEFVKRGQKRNEVLKSQYLKSSEDEEDEEEVEEEEQDEDESQLSELLKSEYLTKELITKQKVIQLWIGIFKEAS